MEIIKKEIPGFPKYYAYNNGEIWSEKTHRFLKKNITKNGYFRVGLTIGMQTRQYLVHRLIALTFLPNEENFPVVNHKDENKQNSGPQTKVCSPNFSLYHIPAILSSKMF